MKKQLFILLLLLLTGSSLFAQTHFKVGDRFTQDGQTGVICWIDRDNHTGWMVALNDVSNTRQQWSTNTTDSVPGLTSRTGSTSTWNGYRSLAQDKDGYANTQNMRAAGDATIYPAAYAVDWENGWYLPSAWQMDVMMALNPILVAGGAASLNSSNTYWTSTQNSNSSAWSMAASNCSFGTASKSTAYYVRSVRNIQFGDFYIDVTVSAPEMGITGGKGWYYANDTVTISATPNYGYHFVRWAEGNTDNPRQVVVRNATTYTAEFAPNSYNITVNSSNESWGVTFGTGTYNYQTNASIRGLALHGYHFLRWQDGNVQNPRSITILRDSSFTATFAIDTFHLNVASNDAAMGSVTGSGDYPYGANATMMATPTAHYHFLQWNDGNTQNPRTVAVTGNMNYTATFAIDTFHLDVVSNDATMGTATGTGNYAYGTTVTLTATPQTHYHFLSWTDGEMQSTHNVTVTQNATYTATFAIDTFHLNVVSNDAAMGSVTGSGDYPYGANATMMATANEGFRFLQWNDAVTDNPRSITVSSNAIYTAIFEIETHIIEIDQDENDTTGTIIGGGEYNLGDTITLTAVPEPCYRFVQWSDGNTDNPRDLVVTEDISLSATFALIVYNFTAIAEIDTMGTVTGSGEYNCGTTAILTATPAANHHFVSWNDGNLDNPRSVEVGSDSSFVALFAYNVGIHENGTLNHLITVYPNPSSGEINFNRQDVQKVEIFDLSGKLVLSTTNVSDTDISKFVPGIYTLRITLPEGIVMKKIVKTEN